MKQAFKVTLLILISLMIPFGINQLFAHQPITVDEMRVGFAALGGLATLTLWSGWRKHPPARIEFYNSLFALSGLMMFIYLLLRIFAEVDVALFLTTLGVLFLLTFVLVPGLIVHKSRTSLNIFFKAMNFIDPRNMAAQAYQAQWALEERNYKAAIDHATASIEASDLPLLLVPKDEGKEERRRTSLTTAHQVRRDAYLIMGHGEYALGDSHVLVQLYPDKGEHYIARGVTYLLCGNLDEARIDFLHGISLPTLPRERVLAKAHLGFIDYILGDYEAAAQDYWRALRIKLHPQERREYMPIVYINIGLMAFHRGDRTKAWKAYKIAFKLAPHLPAVRAGLALLHAAQGEWDKAEAMWRVLIQDYDYFIHPDVVIARHFRWTPAMADLVNQIQPHVQDDITKHLTLLQPNRLLEVAEPPLPEEHMTQNILRS